MTEKVIGLLYFSLYGLLKKKYGVECPITRKELHCDLGKHFLIDKCLRDQVIKELEGMNLIKVKGRDYFVVEIGNNFYLGDDE